MKNLPSLLVADIGGTNIRIALADAATGRFSNNIEYQCCDFPSAQDAIRRYLDDVGAASPQFMCLAVAAPIVGETLQMTNSGWRISCSELRQEFGVSDVKLLNDFEAIAMALPTLTKDDLLPIGRGRIDMQLRNLTVGVLGPGTGLGGSGLLRRESQDAFLVAEVGHGSVAAENSPQQEVISLLKKDYGRVSYERLLSGPGIENIYRCLSHIRGETEKITTASLIGENALSNDDDIATETFDIFFEILGQVAGDFALMIGAFQGMFVAGGIVRRYADMLQRSRFRNGFENKGRYQSLMKKIPTELITHADPGLSGASICALKMYEARLANQ